MQSKLPATVIMLCLALCCAGQPKDEQTPQLPVEPAVETTRIAFGSCAKQWQAQPIWDSVIESKAELWISLGDAIYADTDGKTAWTITEGQLRGEWNRLADKPEFQRARAAMPFMATWDNHDYGSHAAGAEFPLKHISKQVFLTFWGQAVDSPRWKRSGVYDSKMFGPEGQRLQIILLDTKFNRSVFKKDPRSKEERLKAGKVGAFVADEDPAKTHLGAEQWQWLEEELRKPAQVRLLCSSTQVIPDSKGMDEWGNFPLERQRLFDLIEETKANGTILLSGNVHFAELSRLPDGSLVEFTSSGLTHTNEQYGRAENQYRIAGPSLELHFGLVEIEWSTPIKLRLKAIGEHGAVLFEHLVVLPVP